MQAFARVTSEFYNPGPHPNPKVFARVTNKFYNVFYNGVYTGFYPFIWDMSGKGHAHGANPANVGTYLNSSARVQQPRLKTLHRDLANVRTAREPTHAPCSVPSRARCHALNLAAASCRRVVPPRCAAAHAPPRMCCDCARQRC